MPELVKIRGLARRGVRIGATGDVTPAKTVSSKATAIINLDDPITRRDVARHSAIGSLTVVGDVFAAVRGCAVSQGTGLTINIGAGTLFREDSVDPVAVAAASVTLVAADVANPRIDLVVVNTWTGAVTAVAGTAAATPQPPGLPANSVGLAQVRVNAGATTPAFVRDVTPRM